MSSNFDFLQAEWQELYTHAREAEKHAKTAPRTSSFYSRISLETSVKWLYDNDSSLKRPYENSLSNLLFEQSFKNNLLPAMFDNLNYIRRVGNSAAHKTAPTEQEALAAVKYLYAFLSFVAYAYSKVRPAIPKFDESLIPVYGAVDKTLDELQALEKRLALQQEELKRKEELLKNSEAELEKLQKQLEEIQVRKAENQQVPFTAELPYSEAETRRLFINLLLRESGWDPKGPNTHEYPVKGMPVSTNPSGNGYVDYVLWGDDGLPLALVEAKRTLKDPREGQHQAKLYADCLEKMTGQRPVIFYTNGFQTYLWDDTFYPPRTVQGFYTKDELQWIVNSRKERKDLSKMTINKAIADRYYQQEGIRRVTEAFANKARYALLVMATGSGKTRTAAALVDLLMKAGWVRRVLFLADRNALVRQAKNSFSQYLPHLSLVDLTKEKEVSTSRMVFSTYPTIMNRIDGVRTGDSRFYSVGHFDLIIIDEAHRSVYMKYKAIFDYFDALLIGLTATPKAEVDKNTYELFELRDGDPTYAYEVGQAVADKYLVPPKAISVPIRFPREGIRYNQLSEKEKAEYELTFRDEETGELPEEIDSSALNNWLFNKDTVDKALAYLMENGLKVEGGDKLGKTIIFARNHKHALFIAVRFDKMYPKYNGHFLKVIDNYDTYQDTKALDLLDNFSEKNKYPQIAVSVDMLDTGVDVPEVVNLVFFKPVKSKSKFWQMVGRGTRLSKDLFGPGLDKQFFYIFDLCENFEFFDSFPEGVELAQQESLTQRMFRARLQLAEMLREDIYQEENHQKVRKELLDSLYKSIASLSEENFVVRQHWQYVREYKNRSRWDNLSKTDLLDINRELSFLPQAEEEDEGAKRFDILLINLQLAINTSNARQQNYIDRIQNIANGLSKKNNIPVIATQMPLIRQIRKDDFWQGVSIPQLEQIRQKLRELVKFIDPKEQPILYTNFTDTISQVTERDIIPLKSGLPHYRLRVERFVQENFNHITISRLRTNQAITLQELEELERILFDGVERGTKEDFQKEFGTDKPISVFIRNLVGLDVNAAKNAFSEFLSAGNLRADQIKFIDTIISHLSVNGIIDRSMLFEPPFTDINSNGVQGVFPQDDVQRLLKIIDTINGNAVVA
ncbi:DEAD/DEAH box helicase family protein [Rhodocytophaga aerolata]|uniref:DEAD/DEAH box helicase family protein n=1 Tax=Rhodocytophaga aerolata TaxID=455078 RepID=A0ABT8RE13_9BACT|nr:DEAD/DEAH box helicase family protein [Rhodocytophaga aerolata]MDO1450344.1 DEAD/DEAH box helicase family protein [Rhodocytophaga aerolata]